MKLRYKGVLYEYHLSQIEAAPQSALLYQGVFYSREMRSPEPSPESSPSKPHSSGYLNYQLCRLGWQNKQRQHLLKCQHWLWSRYSICYVEV